MYRVLVMKTIRSKRIPPSGESDEAAGTNTDRFKPSADEALASPPHRGQYTPLQIKHGRFNAVWVIAVLVAVAAAVAWWYLRIQHTDDGLAHGNGRIEATEIDVATKIAGRVKEMLVDEGDFVTQGQVLARIASESLEAQLAEAQAQHQLAENAVLNAEATVAARQSDKAAAEAAVLQRQAEWTHHQQRLARTQSLAKRGVSTAQDLDDDVAAERASQAAVSAAKAQVEAAEAAIRAAQAQVKVTMSASESTVATIARIKADLNDCTLKSPRDGRVQYKIAEVGEVLGAGGKVVNLVDLADVYMTFFLPERDAGHVDVGSDARIVFDAAPEFVIPAKISYVSAVAQFTPKTVETATERQKLMFRVKAQIDQKLLEQHVRKVKTGVPGMVWVKIDPQTPWPARLMVKLPPE